MSRWWARGLLALYLAGGAWLTLRPSPEGRISGRVIAAVRAETELSWRLSARLAERGANVALFVPIGLLLCWAVPRAPRWAVWAACVAASVGIEVAQALFLPERHPSVVDIATNSTGAAAGVLLHWALTGRRGR